jgi:hypothetical protein
MERLPGENIVYFSDTALQYGVKSHNPWLGSPSKSRPFRFFVPLHQQAKPARSGLLLLE